MTIRELERYFRTVLRLTRIARRLAILGVVAGVLFLAARVVFYFRSTTAPGAITGFAEHDGATFPIFTFTDPGGQVHRIQSESGSNPPMYSGAEPVTVRFLPADPGGARINSFGALWGAPILSMGLCLFCCFFLSIMEHYVSRGLDLPTRT